MNLTHAQRLAETLTPDGIAAFIAERRPGKPWRIIARDLLSETGGVVDVTPETVRAWSERLAADGQAVA